jgi:antitoxin ParD1/3/4
MNKNTSVSLGDYFENLIKRKISTGRYKNASEVIRAGLRLLDDEENQIIVLQKSIQEGMDSGIASDFHPETHLKTLKGNKKLNG